MPHPTMANPITPSARPPRRWSPAHLAIWGTALLFIVAGSGLLIRQINESRQPAPLRIGTFVWPGNAPLFLAAENHLFAPHSPYLIEYESAESALLAFRNGTIDGIPMSMPTALSVAQDIPDIAIILVLDISHGADALIATPGIESLADLRGKRVGFENTTLSAHFSNRLAAKAGLAMSDIVWVNLTLQEHVRAYHEDRVDAVITYEPVRSKLVEQGGHELFNSQDIPNEIIDVLVVHRRSLDEQRPQIRSLAEGWFEAVDYLENEPEAAFGQITQWLALDEADTIAAFRGLTIVGREGNREIGADDADDLTKALRKVQEMMLVHGLLQGEQRLNELPKIVGTDGEPLANRP